MLSLYLLIADPSLLPTKRRREGQTETLAYQNCVQRVAAIESENHLQRQSPFSVFRDDCSCRLRPSCHIIYRRMASTDDSPTHGRGSTPPHLVSGPAPTPPRPTPLPAAAVAAAIFAGLLPFAAACFCCLHAGSCDRYRCFTLPRWQVMVVSVHRHRLSAVVGPSRLTVRPTVLRDRP